MALRQLGERGNIPESGGSVRSLLALGRRFGRLLKKPTHAWIIYVVAASLEYEDSLYTASRSHWHVAWTGRDLTCRERRCRVARSRQNQLISGVQRFRRNNMGWITDQESVEIYRDWVLMDEEFRLVSTSPQGNNNSGMPLWGLREINPSEEPMWICNVTRKDISWQERQMTGNISWKPMFSILFNVTSDIVNTAV